MSPITFPKYKTCIIPAWKFSQQQHFLNVSPPIWCIFLILLWSDKLCRYMDLASNAYTFLTLCIYSNYLIGCLCIFIAISCLWLFPATSYCIYIFICYSLSLLVMAPTYHMFIVTAWFIHAHFVCCNFCRKPCTILPGHIIMLALFLWQLHIMKRFLQLMREITRSPSFHMRIQTLWKIGSPVTVIFAEKQHIICT